MTKYKIVSLYFHPTAIFSLIFFLDSQNFLPFLREQESSKRALCFPTRNSNG